MRPELAALARAPAEALALGRLLGPPRVDPTEVALREALVTGHVPPELAARVALAARYGEVAVLAAEAAPALRPHLADAVARQRRVDTLLQLGLDHAARALDRAGLREVALLKGTAAAAWAYPDSAWRFRRDLDLLVGPRLLEVRQALLAAGWRDHASPGESPERGRTWSLTLPLGQNAVSLDLHRRLVHSPWCRPDPASILAAAIPGKAPLPVSDPTDTFLHTTLHLVGNGFHEPLKGWLDLLRLLPLVAPDPLAARAHAFGLATATWLALTVLARWLHADTAAHARPLAPPPWRRHLLGYLAAGDHATPERQPLPRALSWRLWRALARDAERGPR